MTAFKWFGTPCDHPQDRQTYEHKSFTRCRNCGARVQHWDRMKAYVK